jgi:hypothetical protein
VCEFSALHRRNRRRFFASAGETAASSPAPISLHALQPSTESVMQVYYEKNAEKSEHGVYFYIVVMNMNNTIMDEK